MRRTHLVLGELAREGPAFEACAGLSSCSIDGVSACLAAARSNEAQLTGLETMLCSLATHGYVAITSRKDPCASSMWAAS